MKLLVGLVLFFVFIAQAIGHECPMIYPDGNMPQGLQELPPPSRSRALFVPTTRHQAVPARWIINGAQNGQRAILEGTIQEVLPYLDRFQANLTHNDTIRENLGNDHGFCYISGPGGYGMAGQGQIRSDANTYLRQLNGDLHLPAGPRVCSRVSCSWCAGIWVCNDNSHEIFIPAGKVADEAMRIANLCFETHTRTHSVNYVMGQIFSNDGFNIIVSGADC